MYSLFDRLMFEVLLHNIGIGYERFAVKRFLQGSRRYQLNSRVNDRQQKRRFDCAALGFKSSYSPKQVSVAYFKEHKLQSPKHLIIKASLNYAVKRS